MFFTIKQTKFVRSAPLVALRGAPREPKVFIRGTAAGNQTTGRAAVPLGTAARPVEMGPFAAVRR